MSECQHERWERIAAADGDALCPICLSRDLEAERAHNGRLRAALMGVIHWLRSLQAATQATNPSTDAVLFAMKEALFSSPSGSAKLWAAMERACEELRDRDCRCGGPETCRRCTILAEVKAARDEMEDGR